MSKKTCQMPATQGPMDQCGSKFITNKLDKNHNNQQSASEIKENKQDLGSNGTTSGCSSNSSSRSSTINFNLSPSASRQPDYCRQALSCSCCSNGDRQCDTYSSLGQKQSNSADIEKLQELLFSNQNKPPTAGRSRRIRDSRLRASGYIANDGDYNHNEEEEEEMDPEVERRERAEEEEGEGDDDQEDEEEIEAGEDSTYATRDYMEQLDQNYSFPRLFKTININETYQERPFVLQPSLFQRNNFPPTIYFNARISKDSKPPIGLPKYLNNFFKWKISNITPNSIRNCISFMEFETIKPSNKNDTNFVGSWYKHMLTAEFSHLEEWRKVNHYPGSFHLGRKDKLWYKLKTANAKFGPEKFGNFQPTTFVLPKDYDELCQYWKESPTKLFIIKPPASARGNGIKVINDISQIPSSALQPTLSQASDGSIGNPKKSTMIVQQYISNPCLLENGQKFDFRVYVLLTSVDPLRIYVYDEGLVRFASAKYTPQEDGIIDQYMHLTNYFINKNNQEYQINNDCDSLNGCKWTLKTFWRYLKEHYPHVDGKLLWDRIIDIIIKTIICCEAPMTRLSRLHCRNDYTSYELFGFDIILDENFQPWILEVNITPSLKSESDLDTSVKYGVIKDMFNIVGYNLPPTSKKTLERFGNLEECNLLFNPALYTEDLTKRDKIKLLRYQKLFKNEQSNENQTDQQEASNQNSVVVDQNLVIKTGNTNAEEGESSGVNNDENGEPNIQPTPTATASDITTPNILNDLTQNDLRVLMLAEDELSRCADFTRVFPSKSSSKYLKYFDRPRYYNYLLDAWEQKYNGNRLDGIKRLSNLAKFLD